MITLWRRITKDGFITYNGNEYSVPECLMSSEIQIRASLEELHRFRDGELVATRAQGDPNRQLLNHARVRHFHRQKWDIFNHH